METLPYIRYAGGRIASKWALYSLLYGAIMINHTVDYKFTFCNPKNVQKSLAEFTAHTKPATE